MLAVSKINQFYGGSHTLWDVDLDVPKGDCVCLMGRNGVGKTTLLKVIMGLLPTVSGEIRFGDSKLNGAPPEARARAGIGYVPQGREIFAQLTVEENLRIGRGRNGAVGAIPERVLTLFPVLKEMLKRRGGDLSGGQQQQLAMGRALAIDPQLLILDEPSHHPPRRRGGDRAAGRAEADLRAAHRAQLPDPRPRQGRGRREDRRSHRRSRAPTSDRVRRSF
jgi:urea transport system ATP-binding protein